MHSSQALVARIRAAEAKRRAELAAKAARASALGTERVQRNRVATKLQAAIQDCARVGRQKAAEQRRQQTLQDTHLSCARSNARAAAIATIVEERHQLEREIGQRSAHSLSVAPSISAFLSLSLSLTLTHTHTHTHMHTLSLTLPYSNADTHSLSL